MRLILCKEGECNRSVIQAQRREPSQLWKFLVLVAMCTKFGKKARSRALFQRVGLVRAQALEDRERERQLRPPNLGPASASCIAWVSLIEIPANNAAPSAAPSTAPSSTVPVARIMRNEPTEQRIWIYGVCVGPSLDLPVLPSLAEEDVDIMIPLPGDANLLGSESPYCGRTFEDVASAAECSWWCAQVLSIVLRNNPMRPEIYTFAFDLYGRLQLIKSSVCRVQGQGPDANKRVHRRTDMVTTRQVRVPVVTDPSRPDLVVEHDCDVGSTYVTSDVGILLDWPSSTLGAQRCVGPSASRQS